MKYLFLFIFLALVAASVITSMMDQSATRSDKPVLYWVTDNNPARKLQIDNFHKWLKKNNYPDMEMRIDTANRELQKVIIQGVSGTMGDVVDCDPSNGTLMYLVETGIVEDVTEDAQTMGFAPSETYPALRDDIVIDGRQYVYPCGVGGSVFFVNLALFSQYGIEPPPTRWNIDEFERIGKAWVDAANRGRPRRDHFMCPLMNPIPLSRSFGEDVFNETLTAATVDSPGFIKAFDLIYKWIYDDHLMPTGAEIQSFSTQSGYGGTICQLLYSGNYAMIPAGRHVLILFRQFGRMNFDVVEFPNGGYPNTIVSSRCAFVYKGSKHKNLARYFLSYLNSEEYNMTIVADGDGQPPNPIYTRTEEYLKPEEFPNEWGLHKKFAEAIDISIAMSKSPFLPNMRIYVDLDNALGAVRANIRPPCETARITAERINNEIMRTLEENPKLVPLYNEARTRQKQIDGLKAAGKKIPLTLITNPFHRKYYKDIGKAE